MNNLLNYNLIGIGEFSHGIQESWKFRFNLLKYAMKFSNKKIVIFNEMSVWQADNIMNNTIWSIKDNKYIKYIKNNRFIYNLIYINEVLYNIYNDMIKTISKDDIKNILNENKHNYYLCNIILNDWQHWHLGNTLTWTPLRDLRIFKLLLQLPLESAIGQITDSVISKKLIERNFPNGTRLISDQKNSVAAMKNLAELYATR